MIAILKKFFEKYQSEIIGATISLSVGMLSGYIGHSGDTEWYQALIKPSFNPPSWIFSPVWTILYIMIGIAFGKLWDQRSNNRYALFLYMVQMLLNFAWSPLFFGMHRIDWALYDILALWLTILLLLIATRHQKTVCLLLAPYFCWVSFAVVLNKAIYQLQHHM